MQRKGDSGRSVGAPVQRAGTALHFIAALMMGSCGAAPAWAQNAAPPPASSAASPAVSSAAPAAAVPGTIHKPPAAKSARRKGAPVYYLIGFKLSGTNRVDKDAIIASLPQHKGDPITQADIEGDTERIMAALNAHHVHGEMTTATLEREGKGHFLLVVWEVHLVDALSYLPHKAPLHFATETFSGNIRIGAAQLAAATGLQPGQDMPDGSVGDARTGIEQAYDKALPGKHVDVRGKVIVKKDHSVVINWQIAEPK